MSRNIGCPEPNNFVLISRGTFNIAIIKRIIKNHQESQDREFAIDTRFDFL